MSSPIIANMLDRLGPSRVGEIVVLSAVALGYPRDEIVEFGWTAVGDDAALHARRVVDVVMTLSDPEFEALQSYLMAAWSPAH